MSERSEYYRRQAAYAFEMAGKSPKDFKGTWLFLSERWFEMAERAHANSGPAARFQSTTEPPGPSQKTSASSHWESTSTG